MSRWIEPVTLAGQHVKLVPLSVEHEAPIAAAAADGELWKLWYTSVPAPGATRAWIDAALAMRDNLGAHPFAVIDPKTGEVVGSTRYFNVEAAHRRLEIGHTWYAKRVQRTALNTEAKLLLLSHAFEKLERDRRRVPDAFHEPPVACGNRAARREAGRHPAQSPDRQGRRVSRYRRVLDHRIGMAGRARLISSTGWKAETRTMLIDFFYSLRGAKLPVSVKEYLTLLEALKAQVIAPSLDEFYFLARMTLVKDEKYFDKFDQAFGAYFHGVATLDEAAFDVPLDWLKKRMERDFTPEEKKQIEALGGLDKLMERLKELFDEQTGRHEGGSKWIGTGGTSPFGHGGYNPEGIRIGGESSGNRTAVKVWDERAYRDYDDQVEIGTRNIKVALRRLRRFAREGAAEELDLPDTIRSTAANAGWLDLKMVPERHNNVKVLMLLDVGGSMDDHIKRVEELFSAAKAEFKHLEFFYFHNCVYDYLWKNNRRRHGERTPTFDVLHKFTPDYKLIFVGDATMSPYEVLQPGGSVEYNNAEAGAVWLRRLADQFPRHAWLNPEPERLWEYRQSISVIRQVLGNRMYGLTMAGLESAMRALSK